MHAARFKKYGDPHKTKVYFDPRERFNALAKPDENGCLIWTGEITNRGYGRIAIKRQKFMAHRWSYETFVGEIPDGYVVDHICNNPPCVNPEHLQAITQQHNVLRSETDLAAINARKTECLRGHPFDTANTYISPRDGSRHCRRCAAERERCRQARKRAAR
ncbi:HNH endonuclease signature motif containing protein [Rhodococcus qingshengii]|uniref:HNH endonuclease signature motif containing protein n=1 Tax=Rhodococcus qingshengii TaxID=334542 RepID=UPI0037CB0971